ncbi:hypothetical protein FRC17_001303 [Serendipita sp. 399]|nr:hypothetical protein FRC17_001303 [Serendipita sp. 399]
MLQSEIQVRNVYTRDDQAMCLLDYIKYARSTSPFAVPEETERLYAKDAPFPVEWDKWLQDNLPPYLLTFQSGDISKNLSEELQFESLMAYIGIGDTYTPGHKDLCGSVGQNLMLYAEDGGCSFWFMAATEDAAKAGSYWRDLGHELELETHVATLDEFAKAPFPVYVCQQRIGDFVIVPPSCCHQVVNSGGITIKIAWSRMIPKSLDIAIRSELPIYQRVCRSETYRVKATVTSMIQNCVKEWKARSMGETNSLATLASLLLQLLHLYKRMVVESYDINHEDYSQKALDGECCNCCGADVWQSAFICKRCNFSRDSDSDAGYVIVCPPCYLDGRSCRCKTMQPVQSRPFGELLKLGNDAVQLLSDKGLDESIPSFSEESVFEHTGRAYADNIKAIWLLRIMTVQSLPTRERAKTQSRPTPGTGRQQFEKFGTHCATIFAKTVQYRQIQKGEPVQLTKHSLAPEFWHQFHSELKPLPIEDLLPSLEGPWMKWLPRLTSEYQPQRSLSSLVLLGWYDEIDFRPTSLSNINKVQRPTRQTDSFEYVPQKNQKRKSHAIDRTREESEWSSLTPVEVSLPQTPISMRPSSMTPRKRPRYHIESTDEDELLLEPKKGPVPASSQRIKPTNGEPRSLPRAQQNVSPTVARRLAQLEKDRDEALAKGEEREKRIVALETEVSRLSAIINTMGANQGEQRQSTWNWFRST